MKGDWKWMVRIESDGREIFRASPDSHLVKRELTAKERETIRAVAFLLIGFSRGLEHGKD